MAGIQPILMRGWRFGQGSWAREWPPLFSPIPENLEPERCFWASASGLCSARSRPRDSEDATAEASMEQVGRREGVTRWRGEGKRRALCLSHCVSLVVWWSGPSARTP